MRAGKGAKKPYLVRGLDPIPEGWELASGLRAMRSLSRSKTVLNRLIGDSVKCGRTALARDLRSVLTAVERAYAHQTGGFVIKEIAAEAQKWKDVLSRVEQREKSSRQGARA